jgi:hypothetical protein
MLATFHVSDERSSWHTIECARRLFGVTHHVWIDRSNHIFARIGAAGALCALSDGLLVSASDPSKICALDFKHEFRPFAICSVSATIGNDRSIFLRLIKHAKDTRQGKRPSAVAIIGANDSRRKPSAA